MVQYIHLHENHKNQPNVGTYTIHGSYAHYLNLGIESIDRLKFEARLSRFLFLEATPYQVAL